MSIIHNYIDFWFSFAPLTALNNHMGKLFRYLRHLHISFNVTNIQVSYD